jgi:5'(3')-deoxyribonucleotidase
MKKLKLALDMDNTINKLSPSFLQYVEYGLWGEYKDNKPSFATGFLDLLNGNKIENYEDAIIAKEWETFENNSYKYYELEKYFPFIPEEVFKEIYYKVFDSYDFWINVPPMERVKEEISILDEIFDLYIVTYPYRFLQNSIKGKLDWVKKHLPFIRRYQIIFEDKKYSKELNYDIIIDDNPDILKKAYEQDIFTVKFNHFYNIDSPCHDELQSWVNGKIYRVIQNIKKYFKIDE